jgi:prepilin-type N-terminal cleavage/methylation domain-containing protein
MTIKKNITKLINKKLSGFTLPEILVSMSLFVLIIILVNSVYTLSQRAYNKNSDIAELTQNARVSLDRMSREIRQSNEIVTEMPTTDDDPENQPATELFFQNGHDPEQITYIRYYLNGTDLKREYSAYYFIIAPDTYVLYNSLDQSGDPPEHLILEDRIVGEYFNQINFWGESGLINVYLQLLKNQNNFEIETSIFCRN